MPALGTHARGTRVLLDVMSLDELTVEASVRFLQVLDAPAVASGDEADEAEEEELLEAADDGAEADDSAVAEAEADAEANTVSEPAAHDTDAA